ncbi:MAG TPA: NAD(P)-dependent alcohol dehydrogenase [Gemmatimonadales bacterium]|nr:NAD(P)-dependent alcohol dehydrogenase [Gemmatimonadales bacterium]
MSKLETPAVAGQTTATRIASLGYAARSATTPLAPFRFERRAPGPKDVHIEILYCGVCHSDLHQVRNEWAGSTFPIVPGHEIVGKVVAVGNEVTRFVPGELAAVGCMVDACGECDDCRAGEEQFCANTTFTYNSPDPVLGGMTYGGYSDRIVVTERFALRVSPALDAAAAAPLLCAGITTYSPLRHWKVGRGDHVGIVGLGGLGHMALKFAKAFGAHPVLFTTSPGKEQDARRLGAEDVVVTKNPEELNRHTGRLDFILNTVAAPHNLDQYLRLLKHDGTMCLVGAPDRPHPSPSVSELVFRRRSLSGSLIGGIRETQEMLDFCAQHGIVSDIEMIPIQKINEAYERMLRSDVRYRFVIDLASLK